MVTRFFHKCSHLFGNTFHVSVKVLCTFLILNIPDFPELTLLSFFSSFNTCICSERVCAVCISSTFIALTCLYTRFGPLVVSSAVQHALLSYYVQGPAVSTGVQI